MSRPIPRRLVGARVFDDRLRLEIRDEHDNRCFYRLRLTEPCPARLEVRHGAYSAPILLDAATQHAIGKALVRAREALGAPRRKPRPESRPLTATLGAIAGAP